MIKYHHLKLMNNVLRLYDEDGNCIEHILLHEQILDEIAQLYFGFEKED